MTYLIRGPTPEVGRNHHLNVIRHRGLVESHEIVFGGGARLCLWVRLGTEGIVCATLSPHHYWRRS